MPVRCGHHATRACAGNTLFSALLLAVFFACSAAAAPAQTLKAKVHRTIPHDPAAFTQGLLWWKGKLYESTGRRGQSELRRIDPASGDVERRVPIGVFFFGEGLALANGRLAMLTWQAERAFFFDVATLRRVAVKRYRGEGWGLCHDGARFVMSNGTDTLAFRDTDSFAVRGQARVRWRGAPLTGLNELECVGDSVYANVFGEDFLVRIDAASGRVTQRLDAAGLLDAEAARDADVLNGIAYDPGAERFYLTGKLWPLLFEVTFEPTQDAAAGQ